ncbi:glycosyltransferase [Lutibacter sp.]|uniref:glycosyltransferase n=1 Tax=Lutibacter sp. TaxID=1925666 RepID=UPI0027350FB9|nr:glycosyltransferase [Lutibacter sp.]MDP3312478.1 glycosyltransferase [Lutibacter sp.]
MLEYVFIAFLVIFCIQFFYHIVLFGKFSFSKKSTVKNTATPKISVIVCAKNEAENLLKNLPFILGQKYPNFEVVLINDCSYDSTLEIMEKFKAESSVPVKIVDVAPNEQFWGSKKYALTLGIKAASNEHLILTDADCIPNSEHWIAEVISNFSNKHQLVLGYGGYHKIKKSFLNKLIRFETLLTAIQYFSFLKIGMPYMGVGRNIAYTKSLFFSANGFVNHMKIKSGDDDLFVNQIANKNNTAAVYSLESHTLSSPKTTFKDWILQKRRHISTATHYKFNHKFLLGLFFCSQLLFFVIATILLAFLYKWKIVCGIILFRTIIWYVLIYNTSKKLNEKDLILFAPFFEIFLILLQLIIFIKNLISKPKSW